MDANFAYFQLNLLKFHFSSHEGCYFSFLMGPWVAQAVL